MSHGLEHIVKAKIFPPIGVCRVGNSESEYFIGPEVPDPPIQARGFYRDSTGALKRQAARFRIYGYDKNDNVIAELNSTNATVKWSVHLANQKAAWYGFVIALNIDAARLYPPPILRNAEITDRQSLIIDPGEQHIEGINQHNKGCRGKFLGIPVYLGELKTDDLGRLIVLGGRGKAGSADGTGPVTFDNNERWYDDISDGPVKATVTIGDKDIPVDPAWVITAPPNYAPALKTIRTMWDLQRDVAVQHSHLHHTKYVDFPNEASFYRDIFPIFQRLSGLQWVNETFAAGFGYGGLFDYTTPEWEKKLSDPSNYDMIRKILFSYFRGQNIPSGLVSSLDPQELSNLNSFLSRGVESGSPLAFPWFYGDIPPTTHIDKTDWPGEENSTHRYLTLSAIQTALLYQWSEGHFTNEPIPQYDRLEEVPLSEQPDLLTRAAMDFCLADAFHPGCELTWIMSEPGLYSEAFRIKHAPAGTVEPHYGMELDLELISAHLDMNPINIGQHPGGLTRWMAVPWHTDTASCQQGYDRSYSSVSPTYWAARVPNEVLSYSTYEQIVKTHNPKDRLDFFTQRVSWLEKGLDASSNEYQQKITNIIDQFDQLGIVELVENSELTPDLPNIIGVSDKY